MNENTFLLDSGPRNNEKNVAEQHQDSSDSSYGYVSKTRVFMFLCLIATAAYILYMLENPPPPSIQDHLLTTHLETNNLKNDKVQVEFFVMSRCPDAVKMEEVFASVIPAVQSIMDVQLNFIATMNPSKPLGIECKHGDAECQGNLEELCALKHRADLPSFWRFLGCFNSHFDGIGRDPDLALKCASGAGLDTAAFLACTLQPEGKTLLKQSVENAIFARVNVSATVFINGSLRCVEDGGWRECSGGYRPSDFIRDICAAYKGSTPRPSICAQYRPTNTLD